MSKIIAHSASNDGGAGPAPAAHNDRRSEYRQAGLRRLLPAASMAGVVILVLAMTSIGVGAAESAGVQTSPTVTAPLEIERQRIDGRLKSIDRRLDDHGRGLIPVEPILPDDRAAPRMSDGATPIDPLRSNDRRLSLERRGLDQRQQMLDHSLERMGGGNPSSSSLLERLRGDQK